MKKNLEIKARLTHSKKTAALLRGLFNDKQVITQEQIQEDIYFRVDKGRLKLRIINGKTGNLIHYFRNNNSGKRVSKYTISETNNPNELNSILGSLFGILIIVKKVRKIIIIENLRFHFDKVFGLGNYLEIEIIFNSIKEVEKQMDTLIDYLNLDETKFIKESYSDLLLKKRRKNAR